MTGYRDRCYCKENSCKHWGDCDRALTEGVILAAREWWGTGGTTDADPPFSVFGRAPECFEESEQDSTESEKVVTEVYKNKAEAVQAAEEAALEKIREGWRVRLIPLYSKIKVNYENLEQGCNATLHFPFRSLDQGDLCEVWNSNSAKCALMVFTGEYDPTSGDPLFSVRIDWKMPSSWKHYRRTGYNAVNRTFQPTEEISFR